MTRIDPELTQIDPQIDLQIPLPKWSPDDPQIPYPGLSKPYAQNKAFLGVLLTVAEVLGVRSKDWIRPPTPFQEYTNG